MIDPINLHPYDTLTIRVENPALVYVDTKPQVKWFSTKKRERIKKLLKENAELKHALWLAEHSRDGDPAVSA